VTTWFVRRASMPAHLPAPCATAAPGSSRAGIAGHEASGSVGLFDLGHEPLVAALALEEPAHPFAVALGWNATTPGSPGLVICSAENVGEV